MKKGEYEHYICRARIIPGSKYKEVVKVARRIYREIESKSKRRPYIRSACFNGAKVFLDNFWPHLKQKSPVKRLSRLKLFQAATELIQKSKRCPISKEDGQNKQKLYRFFGKVEGISFVVQIKEGTKRSQKFFMSTFLFTKK